MLVIKNLVWRKKIVRRKEEEKNSKSKCKEKFNWKYLPNKIRFQHFKYQHFKIYIILGAVWCKNHFFFFHLQNIFVIMQNKIFCEEKKYINVVYKRCFFNGDN